jgi:hypothetical protein
MTSEQHISITSVAKDKSSITRDDVSKKIHPSTY